MPEGRLDKTRQAYDWKTIASTVTADEAEAFDIDRALEDKRAASKAAAVKFFTDSDPGDEA
jgi:hypothetical protein